MTADYKMHISVFISTGDLQAMFTLRTWRTVNGYSIESYIKNLSTDFDKAERLAQEYADNLQSRIGGDTCSVVFSGCDVDEVFKRRGKLSVRDTQNIESIEEGIIPFGKNKGMKIEELPDSYILWLTDQLAKELDPVFSTLCSIASGIAQSRDLLAKREVRREERRQEDLKSAHFGEIGKRYEEDVEVLYRNRMEEQGFFMGFKYTIKLSDQILTHKGKTDLPEGKCRIKFTVKFHYETGEDKVKKTYINRPVLIGEQNAS